MTGPEVLGGAGAMSGSCGTAGSFSKGSTITTLASPLAGMLPGRDAGAGTLAGVILAATGSVARLNSRVVELPAKSAATMRTMPVMAACAGMQNVSDWPAAGSSVRQI